MNAPLTRNTVTIGGALLLLFSPACGFFGEGLTISLTQSQLQRIMNAAFPIDSEGDALGVRLLQPVVTLEEGADRIAFDGGQPGDADARRQIVGIERDRALKALL